MLRFLRALFWLCLLLALVFVGSLLWLVEPAPRTTGGGPPTPEDVAAKRRFMAEVRAEALSGSPRETDGLVVLSEAEANGILRVASRIIPAGHAEIRALEGRVYGVASARVPWLGAERWLNLEGAAPEFEGRPRLEALAVGGRQLPPAPFVAAARVGANLILGERAGDVFLGSARRLEVENGEMRFTMALGEDDKKGFMRGLFGAMRGSAMPEPAAIDAYYVELRQALDDGVLPDRGSYLPHLRFVLTRVLERSTEATLADEYTAGIFGLTKACGAQDFALVVGRLAGDQLDSFGEWRTDCSDVLFADRIDTRRHFTTAAALRAASNRGMSVSVGGFKELYDSRGWKRGGFDFSDIAANQSGIRLSDRIMSGTRPDLERVLALVQSEADILVDLARVPQLKRHRLPTPADAWLRRS